jgi:hypothetical protein
MTKPIKHNDKEIAYLYEKNRIEEAREVLIQRLGITVKRFRSHLRALDKYKSDLRALHIDGQMTIEGTHAIDPTPEIDAILSDPNGVT